MTNRPAIVVIWRRDARDVRSRRSRLYVVEGPKNKVFRLLASSHTVSRFCIWLEL